MKVKSIFFLKLKNIHLEDIFKRCGVRAIAPLTIAPEENCSPLPLHNCPLDDCSGLIAPGHLPQR